MDRVYIVTKGNYSVLRIIAVFSNKDIAKKYAKKSNSKWAPARAEEWKVDEDLEEVNKFLKMDPVFTVITKEERGEISTMVYKDNKLKESRPIPSYYYDGISIDEVVFLIRAKTPEIAKEIALKKRQKFLTIPNKKQEVWTKI